VNTAISELLEQTKKSISELFFVTFETVDEWEKGIYFYIYVNPSKRMRSILDVQREILIVGNTYLEQQTRTIAFAKNVINNSNGRLEGNLFFVVHRDPKGNPKLKKWGREAGITIIPIYVGNDPLPSGPELERLLAFELFSQDPFDITGPVASDVHFFGRRTEAQELARKLQNGQIRACFGIRKIGKTSIMHRVLREIEKNFDSVTVFTDCSQDAVFQLHAPNLLVSLAATVEKAIEEDRPVLELSIIRK